MTDDLFGREIVLERFVPYEGHAFRVVEETFSLPGVPVFTRESVILKNAVVIRAMNDKHEIGFVRQFRAAVGEELLELPAGKIEDGETPLQAANRELREELQIDAEDLRLEFSFFASPGYSTERLYLFTTVGKLTPCTEARRDEDENISVTWIPRMVVRDLIGTDIVDAKSIIGISGIFTE